MRCTWALGQPWPVLASSHFLLARRIPSPLIAGLCTQCKKRRPDLNETTRETLFSSVRTDWNTPDDLFEERHKLFNFDLDVCATPDNAKLPLFITPEQDTFKTPWTITCFNWPPPMGRMVKEVPARCWMNPPYGNPEHPCKKNKAGEYRCKKKRCKKRGYHQDLYVPGIYDFMELAAGWAKKGCLVDCLLPARTDAAWWWDFVWDKNTDLPRTGVRVKFLPGRLKFKGAPAGAPFPSVLVTFMP